jgi:hypothetical protein
VPGRGCALTSWLRARVLLGPHARAPRWYYQHRCHGCQVRVLDKAAGMRLRRAVNPRHGSTPPGRQAGRAPWHRAVRRRGRRGRARAGDQALAPLLPRAGQGSRACARAPSRPRACAPPWRPLIGPRLPCSRDRTGPPRLAPPRAVGAARRRCGRAAASASHARRRRRPPRQGLRPRATEGPRSRCEPCRCGWATAPPRPMASGQGSSRRGCRGRATGGVARPLGQAATKAMRGQPPEPRARADNRLDGPARA